MDPTRSVHALNHSGEDVTMTDTPATPDSATMLCRACRSRDGEVVLDLGLQPSGEEMAPFDSPVPEPVLPLRMWSCRTCGLAQLHGDAIGTGDAPSVEPMSVTQQTRRSISRLVDEGVVAPGRTVAEYGSPHGGSWLPRLAGGGMTVVPSGEREAADVVVDYYGLLHEPDQQEALRERIGSLTPDGTLVLQMLSLGTVLRLGQWYDLRHGHYAYWSLPTLDAALRWLGFGVHRAWWFPLAGGTLLVTARRDACPDEDTLHLIDDERVAGVEDASALRELQSAADETVTGLRAWLLAERAAGRTVAAYGAASRAVPVFCHAELDSGLLSMVGDASSTKQGRRMPGTDIPIVAPEQVVAACPDRVVLFLPDLAEEVRAALPGVEQAGGRWVVCTPDPRVLDPAGGPGTGYDSPTSAELVSATTHA